MFSLIDTKNEWKHNERLQGLMFVQYKDAKYI